jgi:hypothetical protein
LLSNGMHNLGAFKAMIVDPVFKYDGAQIRIMLTRCKCSSQRHADYSILTPGRAPYSTTNPKYQCADCLCNAIGLLTSLSIIVSTDCLKTRSKELNWLSFFSMAWQNLLRNTARYLERGDTNILIYCSTACPHFAQ